MLIIVLAILHKQMKNSCVVVYKKPAKCLVSVTKIYPVRLLSTDSITGCSEKAFKFYDRRRIFDAVAQGNTKDLDDLLLYLNRTLKHLTDDEFKGIT